MMIPNLRALMLLLIFNFLLSPNQSCVSELISEFCRHTERLSLKSTALVMFPPDKFA